MRIMPCEFLYEERSGSTFKSSREKQKMKFLAKVDKKLFLLHFNQQWNEFRSLSKLKENKTKINLKLSEIDFCCKCMLLKFNTFLHAIRNNGVLEKVSKISCFSWILYLTRKSWIAFQ